jgi:hypothetical protein
LLLILSATCSARSRVACWYSIPACGAPPFVGVVAADPIETAQRAVEVDVRGVHDAHLPPDNDECRR